MSAGNRLPLSRDLSMSEDPVLIGGQFQGQGPLSSGFRAIKGVGGQRYFPYLGRVEALG